MKTITDQTKVIACLNTMSIWDFILDGKDEHVELERAIENKKQSIATWESHAKNYPDGAEKFLAHAEHDRKTDYKIMAYVDFEVAKRTHYLSMPVSEITEDEFYEALNVLPPVNWVTINGVNEFCMSERLTGNFTGQYGRSSGKFYHKIVEMYDKTTWIHNFV
jgi:hypothetical protein